MKIHNELNRLYRRFLFRVNVLKKDLNNILRYGLNAPRFCETIWINPQEVEEIIYSSEIQRMTGNSRHEASGSVVEWNLTDKPAPLTNEFRYNYCIEHWKYGKPWEELGVFDYMATTKKYGNWSGEQIEERFRMLDRAFEEIRNMGRLKTRKEIDPGNFREKDGILIHIGKAGQPYFGGGGFHRLAMAKVLEFDSIPACLGVIDKNALSKLKQLRSPEQQVI
jgi:hypothetical protein